MNIDVMYKGLGVEHKMLGVKSDQPIRALCGTRLMHPSATRSIRIPDSEDANEVMNTVLTQYGDLIKERSAKLKEDAPDKEPDLRTGWLLWQRGLEQFLYFEEEALPPNPNDFNAEWRESGGGSRKRSRNVWVYEKETGVKRYSITTTAGAKVQPYFDVPPPSDPNVYVFRVQGEEIKPGGIRLWIGASTARELEQIVGALDAENLGVVIANVAAEQPEGEASKAGIVEEAVAITISSESYNLLTATFPSAVGDEHMMQLLATYLRSSQGQP